MLIQTAVASFVAALAGLAQAQTPPAPAPAAPAAAVAEQPATISTTSAPAPTKLKLKVETLISNVEVPWDIAFCPDGRMIFTERAGRVRLYMDGKLVEQPMLTLTDSWKQPAENGLMGLCLHPQFATNHYVYLAYGRVPADKSETRDVRVVRYTEKDNLLIDPKVLITGLPAGSNHAGCRLRFGPDAKLYITTGESFQKDLAQDMKSLGGKILRINDDGTVPTDNPFVGKGGARPEIYTLGCRNPQGIDWQAGTNIMFECEHGPSGEAGMGGDEFNVIDKPGLNMGWPTIHHGSAKDGLQRPLIEWSPAVAPSGGVFYNSDAIPGLKGSFLVSTLRGAAIYRIILDGRKVTGQETLFSGNGRLRCLVVGPDGAIYVATSNKDGRGRAGKQDDRIFKITAEK